MSSPPQTHESHEAPVLTEISELRSAPTVLLSALRSSPTVVMLREKHSAAAEQYRLLAHAIERLARDGSGTTVALTSTVEGEGKTVTAINLAFALAETGTRKVALCDVDFRGGRVADTMGLGDLDGIIDVLSGKTPATDVVRRIDKNLALISAGTPTQHPLGHLRSPAWKALVASLRRHFDFILFDCPPVCMSDDLAVIEDVIDRAVLVVRSGATTTEAVQDALRRLPAEKVLGFVLNDAPLETKVYRPYKREF
jgi:capsular exopolysaccharide synthesis family protein